MSEAHTKAVVRGLVQLCLEMGHIIRHLDAGEWNWWWTLDGEEEGDDYLQDGRWELGMKLLEGWGMKTPYESDLPVWCPAGEHWVSRDEQTHLDDHGRCQECHHAWQLGKGG